jgi:hypothetical protein
MRNRIFPLLACGAAAAFGQENAQPRRPTELAELRAFLLSASCRGQTEASPAGPAHETVGQASGSMSQSGFWLQLRYVEKKTRDNPLATSSEERWGYDPGLKKFVALLWDSFGGYGMGTSPGWEGDSLIWTGEMSMNGQKLPYRQTFTREKGGAITETWEMQTNGAWAKMTSGTCKPRGK